MVAGPERNPRFQASFPVLPPGQTQSVGEAGGVPHGLQDTAVLMKVFSAPEN